MLFIGDKLTRKEKEKLSSWRSWGERKAFLHQIHKENAIKCQAKRKAWQWLEGVGR